MEELTEEYALVMPVMKDATLVATVLRHTQDHPKDLVMVFTDTCKRTQVREEDVRPAFLISITLILQLMSVLSCLASLCSLCLCLTLALPVPSSMSQYHFHSC